MWGGVAKSNYIIMNFELQLFSLSFIISSECIILCVLTFYFFYIM